MTGQWTDHTRLLVDTLTERLSAPEPSEETTRDKLDSIVPMWCTAATPTATYLVSETSWFCPFVFSTLFTKCILHMHRETSLWGATVTSIKLKIFNLKWKIAYIFNLLERNSPKQHHLFSSRLIKHTQLLPIILANRPSYLYFKGDNQSIGCPAETDTKPSVQSGNTVLKTRSN